MKGHRGKEGTNSQFPKLWLGKSFQIMPACVTRSAKVIPVGREMGEHMVGLCLVEFSPTSSLVSPPEIFSKISTMGWVVSLARRILRGENILL